MLARIFVQFIRAYQAIIAPHFGRRCRFEPSCSRYTIAAIEARGALYGSALRFSRVCKCNPFHPGGYDPPPVDNRQLQSHHESS